MPRVARNDVDTAGGLITGKTVPQFRINGKPTAVVGDAVQGHGNGPHAGPTMATGQGKFRINGKAICREGVDTASCGHPATGSAPFRVA